MSLVAIKLPTRDCLTGFKIEPDTCNYFLDCDRFEYFSKPVGFVRICGSSFISIQELKEERMILSGICRTLFEHKQEPPVIISSGIQQILRKYEYLIPKTFEDKRKKIIEYLILKGGKEYHETDIYFETDFPLMFGNKDEFHRVLNSLMEDNYIKVKAPNKDGYFRTLPTKEGIKFINEHSGSDNRLTNILSNEEKNIVYSYIEDHEPEKVFEFLKEKLLHKGENGEAINTRLLESKYNSIKKEKIRGTITNEEASVSVMKLLRTIMNMLA